mmetsp:Transcript_2965/g.7772  ORF Transcript_2965/g.7772 Transcript_2965/m.7772 type:complete len:382 (+) Transcript_2965:68-1213(+)
MPKRIFLHLDDGSVICPASVLDPSSHGAVKLSIEKAVELQKQSKRVVENLEGIVDRLRRAGYRVPEPTLALPNGAPSKKARPATTTPAPARPAANVGGAHWVAKCREVLNKVMKSMGPDVKVFYDRVSPAILPDYYRVITKPIFLCDIESKLNTGEYQAPQEFAEDVRQHWLNVKLYNPQGDPFRKIGEKVEELFENWWAATGLSTGGERARRATAGHMPSKFDPEAYDEAPAKPSASRQRAAKTPRANGATGRTASHEVTSGGRAARAQEAQPPLTEERKHEIAAYLQELPEEHADHLMTLLPPDLLSGIESGELELDFEALDEATLQKIDAWLRTLYPSAQDQQPQQQAPASPPHSQPGVRVDQYSDEDYEEEDDSDSE